MAHKEKTFGLILAAIAAFLIYLLSKSGLLHESVTSKIGTGAVTPQGTITPDPATGLPRFFSAIPASIPSGYSQAVAPIDENGNITNHPAIPQSATCPIGYNLFKDETTGAYYCIPTSAAVASVNQQADYALTGE